MTEKDTIDQMGEKGNSIFTSTNHQPSVVQMTENTAGEIRNPLSGIPKEQLLQDVHSFAEQYDLTDSIQNLEKGALVAQSPHDFESISELDEFDRETLRREVTHRWSHPWGLYYTIILNSIAAAIQGWDQTGSNGANLSFPLEFGIPDTAPQCDNAALCDKNSWIVGLVNAMP